MDSVEKILRGLLDAAGFSFRDIEKGEVAGQDIYAIRSDDGRDLIGSRGDTVHALDTLVKKIWEVTAGPRGEAAEPQRPPLFLVDVNDYRSKQIRDLQAKAVMMAERARSFQYDVELSPMSAYERLIVHTALQDAPDVKTESQGEGRSRRVVIKYSPRG